MSAAKRTRDTGDESKRRILDAAERLFAERGFLETSLADIAELSGISRGSIPWHFENKMGLLMAVVDRAAGQMHEAPVEAGLANLDSNLANIASRLRKPHMALLHTLLGEASKPDSVIRPAYAAYQGRYRSAVEEWLTGTPEVTVTGMDSKDLASMIYAMIIGINVQWRVDPENVDLDSSLRAMADLVAAAMATDC